MHPHKVRAAIAAFILLSLSAFGAASAQAVPEGDQGPEPASAFFIGGQDIVTEADVVDLPIQLKGPTKSVVVSVNGQQYCAADEAKGRWICSSNGTKLVIGANTFTGVLTDRDGNTSTFGPFVVTRTAIPDPDPIYTILISSPADGAKLVDTTPEFAGAGPANGSVTVSNADGALCSATIDGNGGWACTPGTPLAVGAHTITASGAAPDATPATPATVSIVIQGATPPAPPKNPAPPVTPAAPQLDVLFTWDFSIIGGENGALERGSTVTVVASGLPVGSTVSAELHSTPMALGATKVLGDGSFTLGTTIPLDAELGSHSFVVSVTPPGEKASVVSKAVTIVDPVVELETEALPAVEKSLAGATKDAPVTDRDLATTPSFLTEAINTIGSLITNPVAVATAGAAGLLLLIFVAFPAELLNQTISEQYPRFAKAIPALAKRPRWVDSLSAWFKRTPFAGGLTLTILAALIFGFADPDFGFDLTSLRVVLACGLALFIIGYVSNALTGYIIHRRWHVATVIELKPLGLILTLVGVIVSRLLDFAPGFLIGLLLGVSIAQGATTALLARTALVRTGIMFGFSIAAWVAYSLIMATGAPTDFWSALTVDTLVAITTEGLVALMIGLLPFRFLEGDPLYDHAKWIWVACYAVVAVSFILIIVPLAESWETLAGSFWVWAVGGFATVAVGVYLYFRYIAKPFEEDESTEEERELAAR